MYIGLWSRVQGLGRGDLTRALEDRAVVQGTLLRSTIHLVSAEDYWPAAVAVRDHRRRWWAAAHRRDPDALDQVEAAAARVREALAGGPRRHSELVGEIGLDSTVWNGVNLWLDLVRVPPSGTWERRRADLYGLAEQWLPPGGSATEDEALELLVRRYLGGFGPARLNDVANWAGVPAGVLGPVAARMVLRRFRSEGGAELLDLPGAPLPDPDTPAPVRFLPTWDATLLAHARRTQILPERFREHVFSTKNPQSIGTFLVDGRVAGSWQHDRARIVIGPFGRLDAAARRALDEEVERLEAFHR